MKRLALAVAVLLPSLAAVDVTGARAGSVQILACSQAPSETNGSWEAFNSDPTHLSTGQVCPPATGAGEPPKSTGMFATDTLGSVGGAPDGATAGWRFVAPAGTAIAGLQDDRYIGAHADNGWVPFVKADSTLLETCSFTIAEEGCMVGAPFGSGSLNGTLPISEASTLTVGIKCTIPGGCTTGATLHRAWAALYGAKVTLSAQAPPSIASPTGTLWGAGTAGGFHKGVEQVNVGASDLTGIERALVTVDGHILASREGVCDYTRPLPCQPLTTAFEVDTKQLTDGLHTVTLEAYDAAHNTSKLTEQIIVANQPPASPLNLTAAAQLDGSFLVSWTDPPHVAPVIGFTYQLCPPSEVSCTTPTLIGHDGPLLLPASTAGQIVRVWLSDAAGNSNPSNAASATLTSPGGFGPPPPGGQHLPPLRLRRYLQGHRLTLVALTPLGVTGPVQFTVQALRGRTHLVRRHGHGTVRRGRAEIVFVLARRALSANRLTIKASAPGATAAITSLVLHRPAHRGTASRTQWQVVPFGLL